MKLAQAEYGARGQPGPVSTSENDYSILMPASLTTLLQRSTEVFR